MKILVIPNFAPSPNKEKVVDVPTELFLSELADNGHDVCIVGQSNQIDKKTIIDNKYKAIIYNRLNNKFINYIRLMTLILFHIIKSDFVYLFYPSSFRYTIIWCLLLNKRYGVHLRGQQNYTDTYSKYLFKFCDLTITMSDNFTNTIKKLSKNNKIYSLERSLIPYTEQDICKDKLYPNKEHYKILYLGRILYEKGIEELIKAANILNKNFNHKFTIEIYGYECTFVENAKELISKLNLNNIIKFKGPIWDFKEKARVFNNADIFIFPSHHEGFPQVLHEAMVFGTPIITTFVGGISSLMKDGYNCKRIEVKSPESIAETLDFAMTNYTQMGVYAKNAIQDISKIVDSSKPTHAQQLLNLLS